MRPSRAAAAALIAVCLLALPVEAEGAGAGGDGHVVVAFAAEPTQIDPTRTSAGVDQYFMALFYEQLLAVGPGLEQRPWLAESWRLFERDGVWLIGVVLRRGVRFHNGDELTAHDLRYSWLRQRDPALSRQAGRWRHVDDVRVLGDYELEIVFQGLPDSALLSLNLDLWAIPRRYYEEVGDDGVQARPIGTGPWKFVSRKLREEIVVERFDGYWKPDALPGIRRLTIKIIPEDTTRVAAFKTGAVDWIDAVPPAQVADFRRTPGVQVASLPTSNNLFLALNALDSRSPLGDVLVRRAVAHAIDFDAIIEYILHGQGIRTVQVTPGAPGHDPGLAAYRFDPEHSRQLLRQAGYGRGIGVNCYNLTTPREPYLKEVGEAMFAYLTAAGIRCRIVQLEYGAWINLGRRDARPEMDGIASWMWGHGALGDPTDPWSGHLHSYGDGWGWYSYHDDAELDALVETLRVTAEPEAKAALIRKIARLKHERVAGGIPTYRPLVTLAWRDTLRFVPWPQANWRMMRDIRLAGSAPGDAGAAEPQRP